MILSKSFNTRVAEKITSLVSTMWCAYIFAAIALISLPAAIQTDDVVVIVSWVVETFVQLVLLAIIMAGQQVAGAAVARKITETHEASKVEFQLAKDARKIADLELREIKLMASEVHEILKELQRR